MLLKTSMVLLSLMMAMPAAASCSFRLDNGKLLRCGMATVEVFDRMGQPLLREQVLLGVSTNDDEDSGSTVEIWSYKTRADLGGDYLLTVELTDGQVSRIGRRQQNRS